MRDEDRQNTDQGLFRIGTPECAVLFAVIVMVLALLYLSVGFGRMALIGLLMLAAAFIGGVKEKKQWFKNTLNRLIPAKKVVPYRTQNEEISKALQAMRAKQQADAAADREEEKADRQDG
ncbi:MAG: DUF2273 domain-containing protein [Clostridia bacterium]|nr:DUF2273 domain-containing protein [Clostridia bacterium]